MGITLGPMGNHYLPIAAGALAGTFAGDYLGNKTTPSTAMYGGLVTMFASMGVKALNPVAGHVIGGIGLGLMFGSTFADSKEVNELPSIGRSFAKDSKINKWTVGGALGGAALFALTGGRGKGAITAASVGVLGALCGATAANVFTRKNFVHEIQYEPQTP